MKHLWKQLPFVATGAALAIASAWLAHFRPLYFSSYLAFLPEIYAAGLATVFFWLRARESQGRERIFWGLWSVGCGLWIVSDVLGMLAPPELIFSEIAFIGLAFTFLPGVAMMAALVMRPEAADGRFRDPVVSYEAALVALWWVYLYLLFVAPWRWVTPDLNRMWFSFIALHYFQDIGLILWLAALARRSRDGWRIVYANMACAIAFLTVTVGPRFQALARGHWFPAMVFDVLLAAVFLWLAITPLKIRPGSAPASAISFVPSSGTQSLMTCITFFGIPLLAIWFRVFPVADGSVSSYRLLVSFAALVLGVPIVYRWQDVSDRHREKMVGELESSVSDLRRLQGQFAEAEKFSSLGQLAAGAAHEINNPVAAMLGYAEMLRVDADASPRVHELGRKIAEQAKRIQILFHNLLSLDEQDSACDQRIELGALIRNALDLRRVGGKLDSGEPQIEIDPGGLGIRGDPEKLLQVFYRLLLELDAGAGQCPMAIRARYALETGRVVVEFSAGPGAASNSTPEAYDAHRAQQGAGLSFTACVEIIKEHGGTLERENSPDGRRAFRVSLPAFQQETVAAGSR